MIKSEKQCENCIHCEVCSDIEKNLKELFEHLSFEHTGCFFFKAKSLFVELPCATGTPVYVIERCRCTAIENYRLKQCGKKETKKSPEILARVMKLQQGKVLVWTGFENKWQYKDKAVICYKLRQKPFNLGMITELGKTVFVSLEVAEDRLWEIEREVNGK